MLNVVIQIQVRKIVRMSIYVSPGKYTTIRFYKGVSFPMYEYGISVSFQRNCHVDKPGLYKLYSGQSTSGQNLVCMERNDCKIGLIILVKSGKYDKNIQRPHNCCLIVCDYRLYGDVTLEASNKNIQHQISSCVQHETYGRGRDFCIIKV